MMLNEGKHGRELLLSRPSVEAMTTDQITPEQKAVSHFFPGFWDTRGWGFGVSMVTRRDDVSAIPGRFDRDGGYGTSWSSDPQEDMVAILMTQRLGYPASSGIYRDFWTSAYQAIDDRAAHGSLAPRIYPKATRRRSATSAAASRVIALKSTPRHRRRRTPPGRSSTVQPSRSRNSRTTRNSWTDTRT